MARKLTPITSRNRKVPRTYRLAPGKVAAAQRVLGAATATCTSTTSARRPRYWRAWWRRARSCG